MGRLIHTGLGSSSLIAHVLHSPPPPREQLCNRSCSNKTHTVLDFNLEAFPYYDSRPFPSGVSQTKLQSFVTDVTSGMSESSKNKALTKAYASILDNLDDDQDLTFDMIQQACARKFRRGQDRGDDRCHDPHADLRRPATPCREHKDFLRPKDLSHSKPGDVTAFLCNFLVERGVKPVKVLKTAGLPHATPDDLRDADSVQALYKAADPFMPETVASDTDSAATDNSYDSQAPSASDDSS